MARPYPLDKLIARIDSESALEAGFELYRVDTKNQQRQLLKKKPLIRRSNLRLYQVDAEAEVICNKGPIYQIEDFTNGLSVGIRVDYKVSVIADRVGDMVLALSQGNHPAADLEKWIQKWTNSFISEIGGEHVFINDFSHAREKLQTWIRKQAEDIGLKLASKVSLEKGEFEAVRIESVTFSIVTRDYAKEVDLKITAEISVDTPSPKALRIDSADYIETLVKQTLRNIAAKDLSLQDYFFNPLETLAEKFRPGLSQVLATEGRTLNRFFCEDRETPPMANTIQEVAKEIGHTLGAEQDSKNQVSIAFRANMQIEDAAKYLVAGAPDLQIWFAQQLADIVPAILFKKDISALFEFREKNENNASLENTIETRLQDRAKTIGFQLTALISDPKFDGVELTKSFDIKVEKEFPTNVDQENVKLRIDVTARIDKTNLQTVMSQSRDGKDVREKMRNAIEQATLRYLRTISPEDYYMHFGFSQDGSPGVEERLRTKIAEALGGTNSEFKAEVLNVVSTQLDDDVTQNVKELIKEDFWPLSFKVQPADYAEALQLEGQFRVDNVNTHGWHLFRQKSPSLDRIREHLEVQLENILRNYSSGDLVNRTVKGWAELRAACEEIMQGAARKTYGLEVSLLTIGIQTTPKEHRRIQILNQVQDVRYKEQIQALDDTIVRIQTSAKYGVKNAQISLDILDKLHDRLREISDDPINSEQEKEEILREIAKEKEKYAQTGLDITAIEKELEQELAAINENRDSGLKKGLEDLREVDRRALPTADTRRQEDPDREDR